MKTLLLLLFLFYSEPVQLSVLLRYSLYQITPLSWSAAQRYCRKLKGDLVTALSSTDLKNNLQWYNAWFGLHRPSSNQNWQWMDGTSYTDNHFSPEPANDHNCARARYNYGFARAQRCYYTSFFFCQDSERVITFINKTRTWKEARDHCRALDLELARFKTNSDESPVRVKRSFPVWTGLHYRVRYNKNPTHSYGGFCVTDGSWKWSNGLHSEYRNWAPGSQPGSNPPPGSCVAISSLSKSMVVQDCSEVLPSLCQRHNIVLIKEELNWENALEHCRNISAFHPHYYFRSRRSFNLLSLEENELEFAQVQAIEATTSKVWLGLRFLSGSWMWSNDAQVTLTSLPSCPEFYCGALDLNTTTIQPTDCSEKLNIFCY